MISAVHVCPVCQTPYNEHTTICDNCGFVFGSQLPSSPSLQCFYCAAPISPSAKVCGQCGQPLMFIYRPLQPGQSVAYGSYTVQRALSKGGMGAIYLATDHRTFDRTVVIKEMLDYFDPTNPREVQEAQNRFFEEARTLATLKHPAIPQIFAHFREGAHNYIVMEYIEGRDLRQSLTHHDDQHNLIPGGPYTEEDVLRWGVSLCQLLEYLAKCQPHPVVHHDIKPANVLLDMNSNQIRLVDFGTARARLLVQSGGVGVQQSNVFGTQGYASPEQHAGQSEPRSDVYALAATLYHLVTDDDPQAHPFTFPELARLGQFGRVLEGALNPDVNKRPTAEELRIQLEQLLTPTLAFGARVPPIEAPDGTEVSNPKELADWCVQHWLEATTWLYGRGKLAGQVERLWGKNKLSRDLRAAVKQHKSDKNVGLDAALMLLDPQGYGGAQIQLRADQQGLDFGAITARTLVIRQLSITNTGRRFARAAVDVPSWVRVDRSTVELAPGEQVVLDVVPHLQSPRSQGQTGHLLQVSQGADILLQIPMQARLATPDGKAIAVGGKRALVQWCERHWAEAVAWLYAELPTQIASLWNDEPLAAQLEDITRRHAQQRDVGLDEALSLLDHLGFGGARPLLIADPSWIDFGRLSLTTTTDRSVRIKNIGRRCALVHLHLPAWITTPDPTIAPIPGQEVTVVLTADINNLSGSHPHRLQDVVQVNHNANQLLAIDVQGSSPGWFAHLRHSLTAGGSQSRPTQGTTTQPGPASAPSTSAASARVSGWGRLVVIGGPARARYYSLAGAATLIGRAPECTVILVGDDTVAPRHALVRNDGNRVTIEDLGSPSGTHLNGQQIRAPMVVQRGDVVLLGQTLLRFE